MTLVERVVKIAAAFGIGAMLCLSTPAMSYDPLRTMPDGNSVDILSNQLVINYPSISIGSGMDGLKWEFKSARGALYAPGGIGGTTADNYSQAIGESSTQVCVDLYGRELCFGPRPGLADSDKDGATLSYNSSTTVYTLTDKDGTKYLFNPYSAYPQSNFPVDPVKQIIYPNGTTVTITRDASGTMRSVNNSNGYQIKYEYPVGSILKITAINNAVEYCDPAAATCTLTGNWPSLTISKSIVGATTYYNIVDALGGTTIYSHSGLFCGTNTMQFPADASPSVTAVTAGCFSGSFIPRTLTLTVAGNAWTYDACPGCSPTTAGQPTGPRRRTDPLGHTMTTVISSFNTQYPDSTTDGNGKTTSYQWYQGQSNSQLTKITFPEGNYEQYTLDARGNRTQTTIVSKTAGTPANIVTTANFDTTCTNGVKCNQPNWTKDANGKQTDYTYDATSGLVTSITRPAPTVGGVRPQIRYGYTQLQAYYKNSSGTIVASGVPTWKQTSISECQSGSSCAGTADEFKTTATYGTAGIANNLSPTSVSKGSGDGVLTATATNTYDSIGNPYTVDGPLAGNSDTIRFRYDALRRQTGMVSPDPDGAGPLLFRGIRNTYDGNNNLTRVDKGTVASQSDADWAGFSTLLSTTTSYDGANRKIKDAVLDSGGATQTVTQYSYDSAGRLDCTAVRMNPAVFGSLPTSACTAGTTGSYGPDRISRNGYDNADQLTSVIDAYGVAGTQRTTVTNTYSNNGKLLTIADANNNLTTNSYDGFDRLIKTQYPSPATSGVSSTTDYESYGYDPNGNMTSKRLRDGNSITYGFDFLSRKTTVTMPGISGDANQSFAYDNLDRRTSASNNNGTTSSAITFGYDALSRQTSETSSFNGGTAHTKSFQFDLSGQTTKVTWPDTFYVSYDYLLTGEMSAVRENGAVSGVGVLASFAYDNLGHRTSLTRGNGTLSATGASYGYDTIERLNALGINQSAQPVSYTFGYNPAGEVTTQTGSNDSYAWTQNYNINRGYTANGLNQYTATGAISPSYDARGNLTNAGASYSYNSLNELTGYSGGTYFYDALDRLTNATATSTWLDYDSNDLVTEYDNSGNILRRYVFGPDTNEPLVWYEGSGTSDRRWLHADAQGSAVLVTDSSGALVAQNAYDEYGIPQSTNLGRFQYTGQAWLAEVGMYDYKARIYSPTLGRFMQTDPIGYGDGPNWYNYVHSDPRNHADPTGLCTGMHCPPKDASTPVGTGEAAGLSMNPGAEVQGSLSSGSSGAAAWLSPLGVTSGSSGGTSSGSSTGSPGVRHSASAALAVTAGALFADDATVVGVADDPVAAGLGLLALGTLAYESLPGHHKAPSTTVPNANSHRSQRSTEVYNLINRSSGAIDKIGVTSNSPGRRGYTEPWLRANNVRYVTVAQYSSRYPAIVHENISLTWYKITHGDYPRLNKVAW